MNTLRRLIVANCFQKFFRLKFNRFFLLSPWILAQPWEALQAALSKLPLFRSIGSGCQIDFDFGTIWIGIGFQIEFDIATNAIVGLSLMGGHSLLQRRDIDAGQQQMQSCRACDQGCTAVTCNVWRINIETKLPNQTKGLSRWTTNRTTFDNNGIKPEQARHENTFKDETKFQRFFILNFRRKAAGRYGRGETVLLSQVSTD